MKRRHVSVMGTSVPTEKTIFEAWERWMAEIAGLGTAFPCVPAIFNPCAHLVSAQIPAGITRSCAPARP